MDCRICCCLSISLPVSWSEVRKEQFFKTHTSHLDCSPSPPPPSPTPPSPSGTCEAKISKNKAYKYVKSALMSKKPTKTKNVQECLKTCTGVIIRIDRWNVSQLKLFLNICLRIVLLSTGRRRNATVSAASRDLKRRKLGQPQNVLDCSGI